MDKHTKGAWIVHHGRKIASVERASAEFSAIDIASKAASLLARMAESNQATLTAQQVQAAARVGGLWGVGLLLGKLVKGGEVGPATAIGNDYRALELERVVQTIDAGNGYYRMRLLKREVGEIALQVLQNGDATAAALELLPNVGMTAYLGPEPARARFRAKQQNAASKTQTRTLLSAVRGGRSL